MFSFHVINTPPYQEVQRSKKKKKTKRKKRKEKEKRTER